MLYIRRNSEITNQKFTIILNKPKSGTTAFGKSILYYLIDMKGDEINEKAWEQMQANRKKILAWKLWDGASVPGLQKIKQQE